MKRAFAVSSAAHLAFLLLVIVPGYHRAQFPSTQVINVTLVGETKPKEKPAVKQEEPPAPKVEVKKEPEKPKMTYETKVKTKKAETKAPEAKKKPSTTDTKPKSTGAQPKASTVSGVRVDDEDFRFAYYLEIVKERISFNWSPPPVVGAQEGVMTTVYFRISRSGRVSRIKLEETSNSDLFDRSAMRAVDLSDPLPPLPAGFKGKWLGVHFEFEQTSG